MAYTNLKLNDLREELVGMPTIVSMFPGGIYTNAPIGTDMIYPRLYLKKYEFVSVNRITKRADITFSIVGDPKMVVDEIEDMFITIDNHILPDIDGCLPIKILGDASIKNVKSGILPNALRDKLKNIIVRKTYSFSYLIQT